MILPFLSGKTASRLMLAVLGGLVSMPVPAQDFGAGQEAWTESEVSLPPVPTEQTLKEFFVSASSPNRFLIDTSSLSVDPDGVVRYALVVRTAGGAENVTYEGIRCSTGERRIYASARSDGTWGMLKNSRWMAISFNSYNRQRAALASELICDGPVPPHDRDAVLRRLNDQFDAADFHHREQ